MLEVLPLPLPFPLPSSSLSDSPHRRSDSNKGPDKRWKGIDVENPSWVVSRRKCCSTRATSSRWKWGSSPTHEISRLISLPLSPVVLRAQSNNSIYVCDRLGSTRIRSESMKPNFMCLRMPSSCPCCHSQWPDNKWKWAQPGLYFGSLVLYY